MAINDYRDLDCEANAMATPSGAFFSGGSSGFAEFIKKWTDRATYSYS